MHIQYVLYDNVGIHILVLHWTGFKTPLLQREFCSFDFVSEMGEEASARAWFHFH